MRNEKITRLYGRLSAPQVSELHKFRNSCMSGLIHLFL